MGTICLLRIGALQWAVLAISLMAQSRGFGSESTNVESRAFMDGVIPHLRIEIPPSGVRILRDYHQEFGQSRPERVDVLATVWEGNVRYTDVAVHLKGSYTFRSFDQNPSLTLHFDKNNPGQRFHGQNKIHLNNSVQDQSYLCEQLGRELFQAAGVPCPAAGHAFVNLNGRNLGLYVVIEGANKTFLRRNFDSVKGNFYDPDSGKDVSSQPYAAIKASSGDHPDDRSDLEGLTSAARLPDPRARLAALETVLDMERFISFAAAEDFVVHWDGYCGACNNYALFHDVSRDKMVFVPHGMDQLFGRSRSTDYSVLPQFRGFIARAVFSTSDGRQRYLARLRELSTNEFRTEGIQARVDALSVPIRAALADDSGALAQFDSAARNLKRRIAMRAASVATQLGEPVPLAKFGPDRTVTPKEWSFRTGVTQPSSGGRIQVGGHDLLRVTGDGPKSSGSWRANLTLAPGQYEFSGNGKLESQDAPAGGGVTGVLLRISGERSVAGIFSGRDWKKLTYQFEIQGDEQVELICEFRGQGTGVFDLDSLRLRQKEP